MIAESRRTRAHVDVPLLAMVFGMSLFGIVAVCVATYTSSSSWDASFLQHVVKSSYTVRQCVFVALAPVVVTVLMNIPYHTLKRLTNLAYYLGLFLVIVVLFASRASGVKAWLDVLWGYTLQPSEFVKLSLILMLAKYLSRSDKPMGSFRDFVLIMAMVGIPSVIVLLSGEMGSLLVIIVMFAVMLWFANVDIRILLGLALAGVLLIAGVYGYLVATNSDSYRLNRILAFLNPEMYSSTDAYQMRQSQMTIGSGGLNGIGMFVDGSMSQLNYVPADWTDFIYATIGEAWGFKGCIIILAVYLMILFRLLYLQMYTRDKYGRLVIAGVLGMLLFHVFENIGMTLGLMPITGIPLPFLSYGGSNMMTNMGGIGLAMNVTKHRSLANAVITPQRDRNIYIFSRRR